MKSKNSWAPVIIIATMLIVVVTLGLIFLNRPSLTDEQQAEADAGASSMEQGNSEKETWPILAHLPYKNALFSLGYHFENDAPIITVETTETYLTEALEKLVSFGTDEKPASSYNVKVTTPENIFEGQTLQEPAESDPVQYLAKGYDHLPQWFTVHEGKAVDNYYLTTITTGSEETYNLVKYRVVLEKKDNSWKIVAGPSFFLTVKDNLSAEILRIVSEL